MALTKSNIVVIKHKKSDLAFYVKNRDVFQNNDGRIGVGKNAVNAMLQNADELKALMPTILGISSNSMEWDKTVNNYWNSLSIIVPERGLKLETGFVYSLDKDTTEVKEFKASHKDATDKSLAEFVEGKNSKDELNVPLNERFRYGTPINAKDYLWWRYCLGYGRVANNEAYIALAPLKIKFYMQSETEALEVEKKQFQVETKAMQYFAELIKDEAKATNVLYALRDPSINIKSLDTYGKQKILNELVKHNPSQLIAIYESKTLNEQALVEKYIASGIFMRYEGTEVIVDAMDASIVIGNGVKEVISFISNDANKAKMNAYELRLKQLNK